MTPLWVYKCNSKNGPHQSAVGDWNNFFDRPRSGKWGGTWGIKNPCSVKILRERMQVGDFILAYQTDRRSVVGMCRVRELLRGRDGEVEIVLTPVKRFAEPVRIHELKLKSRALSKVRAFQKSVVQTLYETSPEEATALLSACDYSQGIRLLQRDAVTATNGGGFGAPEQNQETEQAAVRAVIRWYQKREWSVRSVEGECLGYDLVCKRGNQVRHVEVKGIAGEGLSFIITENELCASKTDPNYRLAVVTSALERTRQVHVHTRTKMQKQFRFQPLQYIARLKG